MPYIPLIKSSPLGNVASPVLDTQRRPTADSSAVGQAAGQLASIKQPELPNSLAAPSEALGAVGNAISRAGNIMSALAAKRIEAQSISATADADARMQEAAHGFDTWRQTHPEVKTTDWGPELDRRIAQARNQAMPPGLPAEAQVEIKQRFTRWEGLTRSGVQSVAAKTDFGNAKGALVGNVDNATDAGDEGRLEENLKIGLEKGFLFPHEAEGYRARFTKVAEQKKRQAEADSYSQAEQRITTIAAGQGKAPAFRMLDNGELGNFDSVSMERLRRAADQTGSQHEAEAADAAVNGVLAGVLNSEAAVKAFAAGNPHMTPKVMESVSNWIGKRDEVAEKKDRDQNGVRNAVALSQDIADSDPTADKDHSQYFSFLQKIGSSVEPTMAGKLKKELADKYSLIPPKVELPPAVQQNVTDSLKALFDSKDGAIPWEKQEFKTIKHTTDENRVFGADRYKKGDPVIDPETGKPKIKTDADGTEQFKWVKDPAARQRAIDARAEVEQHMLDWYRANPEKKGDLFEVKKELQRALPDGLRGALFMQMQLKKAATAEPKSAAAATAPLPEDLVSTVKGIEGFKPNAYGDYKQVSIGYGTRARSHDEKLTEEEADARLRQELSGHAGRIDTAAKQEGVTLSKGQRDALISFDFNTGQGAELLQSSGGKLDEVKRRMALYTHAGGQVSPGLVARRQKEISMFE